MPNFQKILLLSISLVLYAWSEAVAISPLELSVRTEGDPVTKASIERDLKSSGEVRQRAVWYIFQTKENSLVRSAATLLETSKDWDDHRAVLRMMLAYQKDLEKYLPDWYDFLDEYMQPELPPDIALQCIELASYWREVYLIDALARIANHPIGEVRRAAYRAMSIMGNDTILPVLLRNLTDPTPLYRIYGLEGSRLYPDRRLSPFIHKLLSDENKSVKIYAIEAFGPSYKSADNNYLVMKLYSKDEDEGVRERVIEAIEKNGWRKNDHLFRQSINDPSVNVRLATLHAIRVMRLREFAVAVSNRLEIENDPSVKDKALSLLMRFGTGGGGRGLSYMLVNEKDVKLKRRAVLASGVTKERSVVRELVDLLLQDSSPKVREESASALGEIGDASAVSSLLSVVKNNRELYPVRSASLVALLNIHPPGLALQLRQAAEHVQDAPFRLQIIKSAANFNGR